MNIIEQFIDDNGLDFSGSGSELNGNCCTLAGFALYSGLNVDTFRPLLKPLKFSHEAKTELSRVFEYAKKKDYGAKWHTEDYKSKYKY